MLYIIDLFGDDEIIECNTKEEIVVEPKEQRIYVPMPTLQIVQIEKNEN
jgi:hypothetical protein